jgi:hypothetical protein
VLLPYFQWFESTGIGAMIRESTWMFPVIESVHLIAFAAMGGAILIVDFRLLGLVMQRERVGQVLEDAAPWMLGSLVVMLVSGGLLFLSESVKCYYSDPFWIKMGCLFLAIVFTWTVRRRAVLAVDAARISPNWGRIAAVVSIGLWGGVAWGGRWIGFSG